MTTEERPASPELSEKHAPPPARGGRRPGVGCAGVVLIALVSAALGAAGAVYVTRNDDGTIDTSGKKTLFQCPMHPSIVQDHAGSCPICGMKLVEMKDGAAKPALAGPRKIAFYRSPMDPKQTSPTPRKDEMGMEYVPVFEDEVAGAASNVPGFAVIDIDPERQQLIGLKTASVVRGQIGGELRTVGRVAVDETRVRHVNVKNDGFVDRVFVDFVGKKVKRGDPLFTIFSPELLAAQNELLLALKTRATLSSATQSGDRGQALVDGAKRRLALWDVPDAEIRRIEETGQPTKTLTFYSPAAGVVTKKDVVEGMKLDAGAMPYEIVDLGEVWVLADIYETELRFVKEGTPASLKLKAFPSRSFDGKIVFLNPLLDPQTRTVKVRLTFANPNGDLRPEMFGEVTMKIDPHQALVIPTDAMVDSGSAEIAFVALGNGKFQPREIEIGQSDGSVVEVTGGLSEGENVVTRANFLVDSESRLRAALAGMAPVGQASSESAHVLPMPPAPSASDGKAEPPIHTDHAPPKTDAAHQGPSR